MRTVRVGILRIRVALGATHLGRRRLMREALHILVAIHAAEHAAMDRVLQLVLVHKQADLLSIHILRQRVVGVASKAIRVFKLLPPTGCGGPDQKQ